MKNIIITGAANGVGKAVANILKENNLILIDEDYKNLEQVAKDLNAKFYVCNLASESDIKILLNDIKNNSTLLKIYKSTGKNFKFKYFSAENSNETFLNEFIIYGKEF